VPKPFAVGPDAALAAAAAWRGKDERGGIAALKQALAPMRCSIPLLYRHYVELCEPRCVQFLAFGSDPAFADCVDGLIRLDLTALKPAKRAGYLNAPPAM